LLWLSEKQNGDEGKTYLYVRYESYTVGKMESEEPEIAVVGTKGQIVIPQRFRRELKITPKTKLVIYRKGDKIVVTRLKVPPLGEELKDLFREIDEQNVGKKTPTEKEILEEIRIYRREKRAKQGA
jgi:AbrB family looped-hinge helix DNA binding protein